MNTEQVVDQVKQCHADIETLLRTMQRPQFRMGKLLVTPGVLRTLQAADVASAICRHSQCDWGTLAPEDETANLAALLVGERLLSSYIFNDEKLWIITEADRAYTTVMLAEEY